MNLGHDNVGWVAAGGNIFRLVFEADSRETVVGSPAIGSNRCSRAHSRLDERNEALGGCVLDTRHADTTGAPTPDFGGNRDNRFLVCFPPRNANLPAAHIGFVDLDLAIQKLSARSNHGPAQLMEPCPSRLITAQAEYSLNPKRTDAVLLIRHIPHRLEPKPQRFPRTLEDRPRGRRRLTLASRTSLLAPGRHPRLGSPAGRTPKPGRPTDTPKKIRTGGLRSEPVVKFHKRARVIDPANGMGSILGHHNILPLRERIEYPIFSNLFANPFGKVLVGRAVKIMHSGASNSLREPSDACENSLDIRSIAQFGTESPDNQLILRFETLHNILRQSCNVGNERSATRIHLAVFINAH